MYRVSWIALTASMVVVIPGVAQDNSPSPSFDDLHAAWEALDDSVRNHRALRNTDGEIVSWESEKVGPFVVVASKEELPDLVQAVRVVGEEAGAFEVGILGEGTRLVFPPRRTSYVAPEVSKGAQLIRPSRFAPSPMVRARKGVLGSLFQLTPNDVKEWAGGLSLFAPADSLWARRALVASGTEVTRRCFHGETDACVDALGLGQGPWHSVYSDLELWGGRVFPVHQARIGEDGRRAVLDCLATGDRAPCLEQAHRWTLHADRIAFPAYARHHFLNFAVGLGGDGAYLRLVSKEHETVSDRLQAAAGLPLEEVTSAWRKELLAYKVGTPMPPPSHSLAAGLWLFVLGFLSTRSTRWRK